MLCDNCKNNQAAVYVEKTSGDETRVYNLCYKCSLDIQTPLLDNILSNILHNINTEEQAKCPRCKLKVDEFKKYGKLGCEQCYTFYRKEIASILKDIQWTLNHKGKIPYNNETILIRKKEAEKLRRELRKAIRKEEFEEAAKLRDRIKDIEKEEQNGMV